MPNQVNQIHQTTVTVSELRQKVSDAHNGDLDHKDWIKHISAAISDDSYTAKLFGNALNFEKKLKGSYQILYVELCATFETYYDVDLGDCTMTNESWSEALFKVLTNKNYLSNFVLEFKNYASDLEYDPKEFCSDIIDAVAAH